MFLSLHFYQADENKSNCVLYVSKQEIISIDNKNKNCSKCIFRQAILLFNTKIKLYNLYF